MEITQRPGVPAFPLFIPFKTQARKPWGRWNRWLLSCHRGSKLSMLFCEEPHQKNKVPDAELTKGKECPGNEPRSSRGSLSTGIKKKQKLAEIYHPSSTCLPAFFHLPVGIQTGLSPTAPPYWEGKDCALSMLADLWKSRKQVVCFLL